MIDLLVSGARIFGKLAGFLGGAGKWFITVLAIASLFCAAIAAILFLTARGIESGRAWARITGILTTLLTLLISVGALTTAERPVPLAGFIAMAVFSVYAVWTLLWHFS